MATFNWKKYQSLVDATHHLFNNKFMSDVEFVWPHTDQRIYAHSLELIKRSPKFYKILDVENLGNEKKLIKMPIDSSYDVYFEFIKFLYTDQYSSTGNNEIGLLKLAREYSVTMLEKQCLQKVSDNLNVDTVCDILEASVIGNFDSLRNKALKYISENFTKVLRSVNFTYNLNKKSLFWILKLDKCDGIDEFKIFCATMRWATIECRYGGLEINGKNKRQVLGDLVKQIRFPAMSAEKFGKCTVAEPGLLSDAEISSLFMSITVKKDNNMGFVQEARKKIEVKEPQPAKPALKSTTQKRKRAKAKIKPEKVLVKPQPCCKPLPEILNMGDGPVMYTAFNQTHFYTRFVVHQPISLVGVIVLGGLGETAKVMVRVLDSITNKVLAEQLLETLPDKNGVSRASFTFKSPIPLMPKHPYRILNFYPDQGTKYFSFHPRPLPWKAKLGRNKIDVEFSSVSKTLDKIRFG